MRQNISALLILILDLCVIFPASTVLAEDGCGDCEASGDPAVIKQLRVEINALNLMNGLHLSAEQVEACIEGARKNLDLRAAYLGEAREKTTRVESSRERFEALRELKEILERGEDPDETFLQKMKSKFAGTGARKPFKVDRLRYMRELRGLEREIEKQLLESQLAVISTYKPCLIPPKNLKDPVRVGQASDHSAGGKMLERLRKLPEARWGKMGRAILEKALEHWEVKHGRFSEEEREKELENAMAVVEESRRLPDIDFEMKKEDLSKRVTFANRKDDLKAELKDLITKKADPPGTIANTLLDPQVIPVLERRLKQLKGFSAEAPVDLAGIKGADAKQGKCGKKYED